MTIATVLPEWLYLAERWPRPWDMPSLAEGVRGVVLDSGDTLWVGWMHADPVGAGHGGRYLDSLPTDRRVVILDMISGRLRGMCERRGFHFDPAVVCVDGEWLDGMVRVSA